MIEAIVAAALHAIVAGTIASAVLFALVFILVRTLALGASTRHALWTIALLTSAVLPLTGLAVSAVRAIAVPTVLSQPHASVPHDAGNVVHVDITRSAQHETHAGDALRALSHSLTPATLSAWQPRLSRSIAIATVLIWLFGVLIGLAGLVSSLLRVRGLKLRSSPLEGTLADELPWITDPSRGGREIYLRLSYETETPVAIGFRRPVILIPTELATAGGLEAIEQLVMHEHAHLRRYDDWTNLAQRMIERLFWFNPLVWIIGRRIALEREIASDDAVVARTGRAKEYAQSLWRLAREMRMPENAVVAPGALLTRKQITVRIESLLAARASVPALTPFSALGVVAAAVCCIIVVATSAPALELPATPPSAPVVPIAARPIAPRINPAQHAKIAVHPVAKPVVVAAISPESAAHAVTSPPAIPTPAPAPSPVDEMTAATEHLVNAIASGVMDSVSKTTERGSGSAPASTSTTAMILRHCVGCDMSSRDLHGADLHGIKLIGTNLAGADLHGADLRGVQFTGVDLRGANLRNADLRNAAFNGVTIDAVSLRGADTRGLRLTGVSLAHLDLRGLELRDLLSNCTGCDLSGADLRGLDLRNVSLIGADLHDADFTGADLELANLSGASLAGANFTNADLRGATFTGVSFSHTIMTGANLDGATFTGADVRGLLK